MRASKNSAFSLHTSAFVSAFRHQPSDLVNSFIRIRFNNPDDPAPILKNNKYELLEQRGQKIIYSLVAVVLSIIAIIVGSVTSIWVAKNITMDVKVDSTQVEHINNKLQTIENRMDSLKNKPKPVNQGKPNKKLKK